MNAKVKIGNLQESSLHAELKRWYACPGDKLEQNVDGYVIDILREDTLIEIQTRNFSAIKPKIARLVEQYKVHLVYPIAEKKWIVRMEKDGRVIRRRKSPKHGCYQDLFVELVRLPSMLKHANFTMEVLLTWEEEIWQKDNRGSWRRKGWSIADRRLLEVVDHRRLNSPEHLRAFLPLGLPAAFTTGDLAKAMDKPVYLAQKMAYCLRSMDVIEIVGKRGNAWLYKIERER
ncbi:MAG: hypothetical protein ACNA8H_01660 [Anaerolineales bacterium]